jgi:site-specific DNA recombinase
MQTVAVAYRRVSSDRQEREGTSLDAQEQGCRRYVKQRGWRLGTECKDVMSGRRDDRPGYRALLDEVRRLRKAGQPVVVVAAALDRLGRRLKEQVSAREELTSLGVSVHFVREGGELPELTANLLASVAQEESARTARRVREGRAYTASRGFRSVGRVPWGYVVDDATDAERRLGAPLKVLREDPMTADSVREMFRRAASGVTIRQIALWVAG